jgi:hypothetical protein
MSDIVHFPFAPFNHSILIIVYCGNFDISQPFFLNLHKISLSIILAVFWALPVLISTYAGFLLILLFLFAVAVAVAVGGSGSGSGNGGDGNAGGGNAGGDAVGGGGCDAVGDSAVGDAGGGGADAGGADAGGADAGGDGDCVGEKSMCTVCA